MKFMLFRICDNKGQPVERQHPEVYVAVGFIKRIAKEPSAEDVTYLDLGTSGMWVRGDYREIAKMLDRSC